MFHVDEDIFKQLKSDFGSTTAIKHQRQLCLIWGWTALVVAGGGAAMSL